MTDVIVDGVTKQAIQAAAPVRLVDADGCYLGRLVRDTVSPEVIAEARRRAASEQPRYSTAEVFAFVDELAAQ